MGISGAFANALSGLTANSWAVDVISNNIANARTQGYGQRDLQLSARETGGVRVMGVVREMDLALLNDQRAATAQVAGTGAVSDFWSRLEDKIGQPGDAGSLGADISGLGTALIRAAAQPESAAGLASVLDAAKALAGKINSVADLVLQARTSADAAIGNDVDRLNTALAQVADLNATIQAQVVNGGQPTGLIDQRQALIDQISGIVPLRQMPRANETVALMTTGGAVLLDGLRPMAIGFNATGGTVTPDMTQGAGGLSGLTLGGEPVSTIGPFFAGGSLAASFQVRDQLGPEVQGKIDGLARNLADRFAATSVDPTLGPAVAGLFTDAGAPVSAANELGLAGRLRVNAAVDPDQGGALWHLRDGIGAAGPGNAGDGSILNAMTAALSALTVPASGGITSSAVDLPGLAAQLLSQASTARLSAQNSASFANARAATLGDEAAKKSVDTDQQMQQLLVVQKSYAANAKIIQAADTMLQSLLEI